MRPEVQEVARQEAIDVVEAWRSRGCRFASIVDGIPTPWLPKPDEVLVADAEERGIVVLSLSNAANVNTIVAAIFGCIERELQASQSDADVRKAASIFALVGDG